MKDLTAKCDWQTQLNSSKHPGLACQVQINAAKPQTSEGQSRTLSCVSRVPTGTGLKFIHEWQQVGMGVRLTVFTIMSPLKPKFWP